MQHVLRGILRMGGFGSEDRECSTPAAGKKGGPLGFLEPWRHGGYTGGREPLWVLWCTGEARHILWGSIEPGVERFQVRVCVFQGSSGARMLCCSNVKASEVFFLSCAL